MWKDPIVEETRKLRASYAESQHNNPEKIFIDILKRQSEPGKQMLTFPPRRPNDTFNSA